jgi:hypothetical protein
MLQMAVMEEIVDLGMVDKGGKVVMVVTAGIASDPNI